MAVRQLTHEEVMALPPVIDLKTAGLAWGFGATKTAELYRKGEFRCTVLKLGRSYKVRKVDLLRSLGYNPDGTAAPPSDSDAA